MRLPALRKRGRYGARSILVFGTFVALAGGSAWAGDGDAGEAGHPIGVSQVPAPRAGDLYPGGAGSLWVELRNPSRVPVTVIRLVPAGAVTSTSRACDSDGPAVRVVPQRGLSIRLAPRARRVIVLPRTVRMAPGAPDACQGAAFTIPVAVQAIETLDRQLERPRSETEAVSPE